MTKQQKLTWQFIYDCIDTNTTVVLLFVLHSKGSSPGRQGFFMAVNSKGELEGSIGGGIMEYKLVEMAKENLAASKNMQIVKKQFHHKEAAIHQSGMICSGEQTILLHTIQQAENKSIEKIINNNAALMALTPNGISVKDTCDIIDFEFNFTSHEDWLYKEKLGFKNHLHIIGGGHCALALSKLMMGMDFYITVYDTRKNLSTLQKNKFAHKQVMINNYSELQNHILEKPKTFVIIMTLGYRTDAIAFDALMNNEFTYLKMLGSKQKLQTLYDEYLIKGIDLNKIKCLLQPAGMAIHSQTPNEIAISIAAEIIAEKNKL
jgi:xanthine dehydrogenase accessory factor